MKHKKLFGVASMALLLLVCLSTTALAEENSGENSISNGTMASQIDLNEVDLNESFSLTENYTDSNGTLITIISEFEPCPQTRGSSTSTASVGSWKSSVTYGYIEMSYEFDLSKSGSQWKISNGRNFYYSGYFCTFSNPSLKIARAVSTSTYPAEIDAAVTASVGTSSINTGDTVCLLNTKVSSSGTVTTTWN